MYVQLICIIYLYSFIALEGYIKSSFGPIYKTNLSKKIGCGSITDGYYKLEVHITNFDDEDCNFIKGEKIKIIGVMQNTGMKYSCILLLLLPYR